MDCNEVAARKSLQIVLLTLLFPLFSEEVAVTEKDFPRLPKTEELRESPVIISRLRGILLVGNRMAVRQVGLEHIYGLQVVDLDVPGGLMRLRKQIEPAYLDHPVTEEGIHDLKLAIIDYWKSFGFPVIAVEVPKQDITDGVLQLLITEGRLGEVTVKGNKWVSDKRIKDYIQIEPGQIINEDKLIRNLEFINRNPFRHANSLFVPGEESGTTDIELLVRDRFPLRPYVGVENTGLERTGRTRLFAGANWGNAFWLDDILSYQYTSSTNFSDFQSHTGSYTAFLPWQHILNIFGGYSRVSVDLNDGHRTTGHSSQASGRYDIPLKPRNHYLHDLIFGFDFKRYDNTFEFTEEDPIVGKPVNITQFVFGYRGNYEKERNRVAFSSELFWQPGQLVSDQSDSDFQTLSPDARNDWVYTRLELTYRYGFPKDFGLKLLAKGQFTNHTLLPSEQFGLGGYASVRGYEEYAVTADAALLLSGEIETPPIGVFRHHGPGHVKDALKALIFLDYGYGNDKNPPAGTKKVNWLMGIGPGLRYDIDPYLSARFDWGIKLHKKGFDGGWSMIHFGIIASY